MFDSVKAEPYMKGMEDGYTQDDSFAYCNSMCQDTCHNCPAYRPFIRTSRGKVFVNEGDWIVTIRGESFVMPQDSVRRLIEFTFVPDKEEPK